MKSVKLGIIGIGNMGSGHARKVQAGDVPNMELAAICDRNPEKKNVIKDVSFYDNADELINDPNVDAVLIATPHYDHTTLGVKVLDAGKHLLVEKPISVHKQDCEKLIAAHTNKDQVFAAMFNQRTDPHYTKLKELIDGGELGEIRRVVWIITNWFRTQEYYNSGGWRATWKGEGGGVLLNQCPHQLDLWQWLFGMPEKIRSHCSIGRYHEIEVEDDVTCYMEYSNGMKGVFITTTGEAPGTNRLEVTAENGKVVIEGDGIQWTRNEKPMTEWSHTTTLGFQKPATWEIKIPVNGNGEQHVGIMKNFTDVILNGADLIAPAEEGIHSVELANGMLYSSFTDSTISFPLDGDAYATLLNEKITNSKFVKNESSNKGTVDFDHS